MTETKPPPIIVGVQGFNATRSGAEPRKQIQNLCRLPTFQMWIEEGEPNHAGIRADQYAAERAMRRFAARGIDATLDEYERWHAAKGAWPNETPYGELKT